MQAVSRRIWHCSLVMRREETELVNGRMKIIDTCRNCGWSQMEIYSATGQMVLWRNLGKPSQPAPLVQTGG